MTAPLPDRLAQAIHPELSREDVAAWLRDEAGTTRTRVSGNSDV